MGWAIFFTLMGIVLVYAFGGMTYVLFTSGWDRTWHPKRYHLSNLLEGKCYDVRESEPSCNHVHETQSGDDYYSYSDYIECFATAHIRWVPQKWHVDGSAYDGGGGRGQNKKEFKEFSATIANGAYGVLKTHAEDNALEDAYGQASRWLTQQSCGHPRGCTCYSYDADQVNPDNPWYYSVSAAEADSANSFLRFLSGFPMMVPFILFVPLVLFGVAAMVAG